MEDWERLWRDENTPPYEVLRVEAEYRWPTGLTRYKVYYRTYKRAMVNYVLTIDDLGAFIAGTALMKKLRAQSDKYREKYK